MGEIGLMGGIGFVRFRWFVIGCSGLVVRGWLVGVGGWEGGAWGAGEEGSWGRQPGGVARRRG